MPSLLEYLIVYYFIPSLFEISLWYPSILDLIIPESILMFLPFEISLLDYLQFFAAFTVTIVGLVLGYRIYKKNPSYWLNKLFAACYVGISLSAISFALGLFTNATGLILGQKFMFTFLMITIGLLLLVAVGLNYGEFEIQYPRIVLPIMVFVVIPLIILWLPGSIRIQDVAPSDIIFSDFFTVSILITIAIGLSTLSYFLIKVYRVSEGLIKKRILFFLIGILFTILVAGISVSFASILNLQLFDFFTPLIILVGISIIYYGFHISE